MDKSGTKWKIQGHWDESGFLFGKEMLNGDFGYGINFDTIRKHNEKGYIIFEFLLCEFTQKVTPHTSHPNRYWHKNKLKFMRLFELSVQIPATLYLVNYAKLRTPHEDKVLVIKILELCEINGITKQQKREFTRKEFSDWFRQINKESNGLIQPNSNDNK